MIPIYEFLYETDDGKEWFAELDDDRRLKFSGDWQNLNALYGRLRDRKQNPCRRDLPAYCMTLWVAALLPLSTALADVSLAAWSSSSANMDSSLPTRSCDPPSMDQPSNKPCAKVFASPSELNMFPSSRDRQLNSLCSGSQSVRNSILGQLCQEQSSASGIRGEPYSHGVQHHPLAPRCPLAHPRRLRRQGEDGSGEDP